MEDTKLRLPVDHGWAWWVMVGYFLNVLISLSWVRALAILLPVFLEKYNQPTTVTTLAFGISEIAEAMAHITLSLALMGRFSVRSLTLFGAVANVSAILSLCISPNIFLLNTAFAVIGFARGVLMNPQIYLLGVYFKKRHSFASALANTGLSMATLFSPLLTQLLLNTYGLTGTFLIFGAIAAHSVIASLLFRPVSMYDTGNALDSHEESTPLSSHENDNKNASTQDVSHFDKLCEPKITTDKFKNDQTSPYIHSKETPKILSQKSCIPSNVGEGQPGINDRFHNNDAAKSNFNGIRKIKTHGDEDRNEAYKHGDDEEHEKPEQVDGNETKHDDVYNTCYNCQNKHHRQQNFCHNETLNEGYKLKHSKQRCDICKTEYKIPYEIGQSIDIELDDACEHSTLMRSHLEKETSTNTISKMLTNEREKQHCTSCLKTTSCNQLKNPTTLFIVLAGVVGVQTQCGSVYLPVMGLENGLSSSQLPWLLTIAGVSDILGKLLFGLIADRRLVRPTYLVCWSQFTVGLAFQFVSFYQGLVPMVTMSLLFGFNAGLMHTLLAPITIEFIGLPSLPFVTSSYFLGNCVMTFLAHLVVGSIKDFTGSFTGGFQFVGALMLASVLLLLTAQGLSQRKSTTVQVCDDGETVGDITIDNSTSS